MRNSLRWMSGMIAVVFLLFYGANSWVSGPAYLADEVGYLNNAAFLGGRFVDGASSYHAGYSMFLAPLFYFLSDPSWIWSGVLILNALMWAATFCVLFRVLARIFPSAPNSSLLVILIPVVCYPANLVISGYAFSQTAVALVYLLAIGSIFLVDARRAISIVAHALCIGLLFWIHPTGIATTVASVVAIAFMAYMSGHYKVLFVHVVVAFGLVALYKIGIDPWRVQGMTPPGATTHLHYPSIGKVLLGLLNPEAWPTVLSAALGQLAYVLIATFGFALLGAFAIAKRLRNGGAVAGDELATSTVLAFILLAVIGCIGLTAITLATGRPDRLDHWVYGRYLDPLILPLFAVGLRCEVKRWPLAIAAVLVSLLGFWLVGGMGADGPVNRVNIAGLWPEALLGNDNLIAWLTIGGLAMLAVSVIPSWIARIGIVAIYIASAVSQLDWHKSVLEGHSNPSEVVEFVRENFEDGCVTFDPSSLPPDTSPFSMRAERGALYSFYFFNYKFEKNGSDAWVNKCDGPLLTYDAEVARKVGATVVGVEKATGLKVVVKGAASQYRYPRQLTDRAGESYWIFTSPSCALEGTCLHATYIEMASRTQVGVLTPQGLTATGKSGFLFFGPYATMPRGTYNLVLRGNVKVAADAVLDVVSEKGANRLLVAELSSGGSGELGRWRFTIEKDVSDLEIRLYVGQSDVVTVSEYSLEHIQDQDGNPPGKE